MGLAVSPDLNPGSVVVDKVRASLRRSGRRVQAASKRKGKGKQKNEITNAHFRVHQLP